MPRSEIFNFSSLVSLQLCTSEGGALAQFRSAGPSSTTRNLSPAKAESANQPLYGTLVYIAGNAADTVQVIFGLLRMEVQCPY